MSAQRRERYAYILYDDTKSEKSSDGKDPCQHTDTDELVVEISEMIGLLKGSSNETRCVALSSLPLGERSLMNMSTSRPPRMHGAPMLG
jgi:hypothetical protein